jgi:hypothetical protein
VASLSSPFRTEEARCDRATQGQHAAGHCAYGEVQCERRVKGAVLRVLRAQLASLVSVTLQFA